MWFIAFGIIRPLEELVNTKWYQLVSLIVLYGFQSIWLFGPTLFLIRAWLLYFDMKLSRLIRNHNWIMAINPFFVSNNNWFLNPKNQRFYAKNGKLLCVIGICISISETILSVILYYIFNLFFIANLLIFIVVFIQVK